MVPTGSISNGQCLEYSPWASKKLSIYFENGKKLHIGWNAQGVLSQQPSYLIALLSKQPVRAVSLTDLFLFFKSTLFFVK